MIKLLTRLENRNFQRLWWGQLISQFGDRIHQMALVALVAERAHGSTLMLAKLMACTIIPVFFIQPIAGVLVDRWDRRMTLLICDIARGILVLLIPLVFIFWKTLVPINILVFLVFCFSRFYQPAKMSIIPDLVPKDYLLTANSLVSTTGMIAFILGCALGGILVDRYGARVGFMVDAATFFISGAFVFSIDISRRFKVSRELLWKAGREIVGPRASGPGLGDGHLKHPGRDLGLGHGQAIRRCGDDLAGHGGGGNGETCQAGPVAPTPAMNSRRDISCRAFEIQSSKGRFLPGCRAAAGRTGIRIRPCLLGRALSA